MNMNDGSVLRFGKYGFENEPTFASEMFAYILIEFYYSQNDKASLK